MLCLGSYVVTSMFFPSSSLHHGKASLTVSSFTGHYSAISPLWERSDSCHIDVLSPLSSLLACARSTVFPHLPSCLLISLVLFSSTIVCCWVAWSAPLSLFPLCWKTVHTQKTDQVDWKVKFTEFCQKSYFDGVSYNLLALHGNQDFSASLTNLNKISDAQHKTRQNILKCFARLSVL